ncbi:MAG: hypothetical protein ACR2O5_06605 [Thiogranum sp.]
MPPTFREQLDAVNDKAKVRRNIEAGLYDEEHRRIAQEWIRCKEEALAAEAAARTEAQQVESLSISRKALHNSERANRIAIIAFVLSVITAIAVAIIEYLKP